METGVSPLDFKGGIILILGGLIFIFLRLYDIYLLLKEWRDEWRKEKGVSDEM